MVAVSAWKETSPTKVVAISPSISSLFTMCMHYFWYGLTARYGSLRFGAVHELKNPFCVLTLFRPLWAALSAYAQLKFLNVPKKWENNNNTTGWHELFCCVWISMWAIYIALSCNMSYQSWCSFVMHGPYFNKRVYRFVFSCIDENNAKFRLSVCTLFLCV